MKNKTDREIYGRIADGIDDEYVGEMLETLQNGAAHSRRGHAWLGAFFAAVAVIALLALGTVNILHHQQKGDITAQESKSETETRGDNICIAVNHTAETSSGEEYFDEEGGSEQEALSTDAEQTVISCSSEYPASDWQTEPMYAFYNGKLYAFQSNLRTMLPLDAELVGMGKVVKGQPQNELEVSGVPEGTTLYYCSQYDNGYVYLSTGYEFFLLEELDEHGIAYSYRYSYDLLSETIKECYPLPNEEQMKQWVKQIQNFTPVDEMTWPGHEENLCLVLNYFDVMDIGETELFVLMDMDIKQAEDLTGTALTEILVGDVYKGVRDATNGAYGYVPASTLLNLLNEGYGTQIFLVQIQKFERFLPEGYNIGSTSILNLGMIYEVLFYQYNGMSVFYTDEEGKTYLLKNNRYCE